MKTTTSTLLLLAALSPFMSWRQSQERDQQKEQAYAEQLRVDEFHAATAAMDAQSYAVADSLFTIVCEHAPEFDPAIRRLATVKASQGKVNEGIALCEESTFPTVKSILSREFA